MKFKKKLLWIATLSLIPVLSYSYPITSIRFATFCDQNKTACQMYFQGLIDGINYQNSLEKNNKEILVSKIPKGTTYSDAINDFISYMKMTTEKEQKIYFGFAILNMFGKFNWVEQRKP